MGAKVVMSRAAMTMACDSRPRMNQFVKEVLNMARDCQIICAIDEQYAEVDAPEANRAIEEAAKKANEA